MPNRKLNVFLCHAKEDKPTVRELFRQLTAEGWMDVWLDEENLLPGQEAIVTIGYAVELPMSDDQIRLMIPTTVSPRYVPDGYDPVKADVISPPVSLAVPYGLFLSVKLLEGKRT